MQEVSTLTSGVCGRNFEPPGCLDAAGQSIGQDVISGYINQVLFIRAPCSACGV